MDIITLEEIANGEYTSRHNIHVTQALAGRSSLIRTMNFAQASHGNEDKFEVATELPVGGFRKYNEGFPASGGASRIAKVELMPFGFKKYVDADLIKGYPGGLDAYLRRKANSYYKGLGVSLAKDYIYGYAEDANGPNGLRQWAIENGNYDLVYGSAAISSSSTILIVKWDEEACTGLYNGNNVANGIFMLEKKHNGNTVDMTDAQGRGYDAYAYGVDEMLGLKLVGTTNVAALCGIKNAANYIPTAAQIDKLLTRVDAEASNTVIYMNGTVLGLIRGLSGFTNSGKDANVVRTPKYWDDIPIMVESAIVNTETAS